MNKEIKEDSGVSR